MWYVLKRRNILTLWRIWETYKYINTIEEYGKCPKLWICEFCLKYMKLEKTYRFHQVWIFSSWNVQAMIIFRWCFRAITNIQTSWLLLIAGRVHSEKPSRQGDLQKGQPQHLWGKVGLQWFIENLKVLSETQILRWMGKTTSCTARTSASWPSYSSTTRPSISTSSLSFSTFSARWTGSGCLETLEPFKT